MTVINQLSGAIIRLPGKPGLEEMMNRPAVLLASATMFLVTGYTLAAADDAQVVAGKAFFAENCQTCHNPEADRKTYGPPLAGVVGRKAGSVDGYPYSDALKNSGIVWTEAPLKAWMADNDGMMPGTRMRHVGVSEPAEQDMIIAYLKSLTN